MTTSTNRGRGFAALTTEQRKEIASQGGRAAHAGGNAHQFTKEEASAAGKKRHANAQRRRADQAATETAGS